MSDLMDYIREFSCDRGELPLVHTTDKFTLQLIRDSKRLETKEDSVYNGEKLLYMFYGRPSFRVNSNINHTSASFFAPVCLIFDRDLLGSAYRIMPFDTGAHHDGMLKETIHKSMDRSRFALDVDPDSPMKLIKCFYGDEMSYLDNRPSHGVVDLDELQKSQKHYVEAYYHLVHHRSNSALDERVNAVEVQFDKDIDIAGQLRAVILPSRFFTAEVITNIENEFAATAIMYDMPATYKPSELMNTIYEKVKNFIVSNRV
ncbi:hypothetical protein [Methylobacterium sp. PvR107]|uniref:hypothetical protein n=1 Tax=Methylobacterium sp. PvR107 TaxID=2806597 RepID=UPI001AE2573F|nr:hypothetical protein [Methylobacterium sp. PvR107]MBP1182184.1 hypothetical protein [Methylobacterium sp. PvR107]